MNARRCVRDCVVGLGVFVGGGVIGVVGAWVVLALVWWFVSCLVRGF